MYDELTAGTYTLPWLLRMANVQGKYRFWSPGEWDFAVRTGFSRLDLTALAVIETDSDAVLRVLPLELVGSYRGLGYGNCLPRVSDPRAAPAAARLPGAHPRAAGKDPRDQCDAPLLHLAAAAVAPRCDSHRHSRPRPIG
ncbi:MAG: hypothetical protein OXT09_21250 [Myxococcales bacterium]|nr:hypothetical protein [Myxococcales bacterium]